MIRSLVPALPLTLLPGAALAHAGDHSGMSLSEALAHFGMSGDHLALLLGALALGVIAHHVRPAKKRARVKNRGTQP